MGVDLWVSCYISYHLVRSLKVNLLTRFLRSSADAVILVSVWHPSCIGRTCGDNLAHFVRKDWKFVLLLLCLWLSCTALLVLSALSSVCVVFLAVSYAWDGPQMCSCPCAWRPPILQSDSSLGLQVQIGVHFLLKISLGAERWWSHSAVGLITVNVKMLGTTQALYNKHLDRC